MPSSERTGALVVRETPTDVARGGDQRRRPDEFQQSSAADRRRGSAGEAAHCFTDQKRSRYILANSFIFCSTQLCALGTDLEECLPLIEEQDVDPARKLQIERARMLASKVQVSKDRSADTLDYLRNYGYIFVSYYYFQICVRKRYPWISNSSPQSAVILCFFQ